MRVLRRAERFWNEPAQRIDAWVVLGLAFAVRLGVSVWAGERFPPAEDGQFYHVVAERIAQGLGYTWLWPDGAVTYAAHYPVGYPAMLAVAYWLFGASPIAAMCVNTAFGSVAAFAAHRIAAPFSARGGALFAGALVALHPGLAFYTPALMTEGVTAALLALTGWSCVATARASGRRQLYGVVALGLLLGVATLVRPQSVLMAPIVGALAVRETTFWRRLLPASAVTLIALAVCAPWTLRNCLKMDRCTFVSANAGWNMFIGTAPEGEGSWIALDKIGVPEECREVFGEATKDACFRRAAIRRISHDMGGWLSLVPAKLGKTFNLSTGPGDYLQSSNADAFDGTDKLALNSLQTIYDRALVALALVAAARWSGPRRRERRAVAILTGALLLTPWAWGAYLGLVLVVVLLGRALPRALPLGLAAGAIGTTAIVHAVFFGAGRYALVAVALLAAAVGTALTRKQSQPRQTGQTASATGVSVAGAGSG